MKNEDIISIVKLMGFMVLLVGVPLLLLNWTTNAIEELEAEEQEIMSEQNERAMNEWWCKSNSNTTIIDYELIQYHNLTCEEIKFNIDNWIKQYSHNKKYVGGSGLFTSGKYQYVEEYHGVGHIKLLKTKAITYYPKDDRCWSSTSTDTNIYLEKDWVNYYAGNCLINQT